MTLIKKFSKMTFYAGSTKNMEDKLDPLNYRDQKTATVPICQHTLLLLACDHRLAYLYTIENKYPTLNMTLIKKFSKMTFYAGSTKNM